jgi:hypothetical protein
MLITYFLCDAALRVFSCVLDVRVHLDDSLLSIFSHHFDIPNYYLHCNIDNCRFETQKTVNCTYLLPDLLPRITFFKSNFLYTYFDTFLKRACIALLTTFKVLIMSFHFRQLVLKSASNSWR